MAEPEKSPLGANPSPAAPAAPEPSPPAVAGRRTPEEQKSEDDLRARAAAVNRKRTLDDWEEKKRLWRAMGVPPALPAAGSTKTRK